MTLVPRLLVPRLERRLAPRRVVVLTGARQTGKTTLVRDLLTPDLDCEPVYRTLDDLDDRARLASDPVGNLDRAGRLVIVDEVQKLPTLLDSVKLLADRKAGPRFLLLGSSQILLMRSVRESLAGRAAFLDLWPLSVSERTMNLTEPRLASGMGTCLLDRIWEQGAGALDDAASTTMTADRLRQVRGQAEVALRWGGYPAVSNLPDDTERSAWFQDYRRSFLERDLADLGRVSALDQMSQTQVWLSGRSGEILNFSNLSRDLGISVNTAKRYTRFLEISYQVVLVPPFLPRIEQRVAKNPKLYWTDVGLVRALSRRFDENDGPFFETFVASEFVKWKSFRDDAPDLCYFRTHGGVEVDLVLTQGKRVLGIECKAARHAYDSDARPLERFLDLVKSKDGLGLVVYRGRDLAQLSKRVWAVPDWRLFGAT